MRNIKDCKVYIASTSEPPEIAKLHGKTSDWIEEATAGLAYFLHGRTPGGAYDALLKKVADKLDGSSRGALSIALSAACEEIIAEYEAGFGPTTFKVVNGTLVRDGAPPPDVLTALKEGVQKWEVMEENPLAHDGSAGTCSLCILFGGAFCRGCPVYETTGVFDCRYGTSYRLWRQAREAGDERTARNAASAMKNFMKLLLRLHEKENK